MAAANLDHLSGSPNGLGIALILRRHRLLIAGVFAFCAAVAGIAGLFQTPLYRARTVLEVQARNPAFLNITGLDPTTTPLSDSFIATQMKLIRTEALAKRVVERANLRNERALFQQSKAEHAIRRLFGQLTRKQPVSENAAIARLLGSITVKADGDSDLIILTLDTPDKNLSAKLANMVSSEFIDQEQEARWTEAMRVGKWLTAQLDDFRGKLLESEKELQKYADKEELLFTGDHDSVAEDKLRQIQQELSRTQADTAERQSQLEVISGTVPEAQPRILDDSLSRELAGRLAEAKRHYAELSANLTPTHYKVQTLQAEIAELEDELNRQRNIVLRRIRNEYDAAVRREALVQGSYDKQTQIVSDQAARAVHYNVLKREADTNRELYSSMLQKVKEASIVSALRTNSIHVVDPAKPPAGRYRPNKAINFGFGMLGAFMLSTLLVLGIERSNRMIREPGDTVRLQIRELGVIPSSRSDPRLRGSFAENGRERLRGAASRLALTANDSSQIAACKRLVTWTNRRTLMAEAFRSAALSVRNSKEGSRSPKVVVVTSSQPRAGKSTAAANLGVAMADHQRKVLLIDGDLRRPALDAFFGLNCADGLAQILQSETPIASYDLNAFARVTGIAGLRLLPAGSARDVDPSVLGSDRFGAVIAQLRTHYDFILIDSPPLLGLPDTRLICRAADGAVLISRAGKTRVDLLMESVNILEADGVRLLGTILNDWKTIDPSYYEQYYSTYASV